MSKEKIITAVGVGLVAAMPFIAMAQTPGPVTTIDDVTDVYDLLRSVLTVLRTVFFIVAAIFIVIAAFKYLTAQGDPEKVGEARQMIVYAVIAIAVALLATVIDNVVRNFLQTPPATTAE